MKEKKKKEKENVVLVVIEALRRTICRGKSFIGFDSRRDSWGLIGVNLPRRLTLRVSSLHKRSLLRAVYATRARIYARSHVEQTATAQRRTNVATLENSHSGMDEITVLHISKLLRQSVIEIHYAAWRAFRLFHLTVAANPLHRCVTWRERIL